MFEGKRPISKRKREREMEQETLGSGKLVNKAGAGKKLDSNY